MTEVGKSSGTENAAPPKTCGGTQSGNSAKVRSVRLPPMLKPDKATWS